MMLRMHPYPFRELEPLTWPETVRAMRWPGAFGIVTGMCAGTIADAFGAGSFIVFLVSFGAAFIPQWSLFQRARERALWRKWNSLEA